MLDAGPYTLNQQPHRLAGNLDETLDAKDVMLRRRLGNSLNQGLRRFETPEIDDKGLEIVVIVLGLSVVMGEPICNVIFGCDP